MHENQPMPVTLAIADCRLGMQVLGFQGRDGLNEVYRYDIDLIANDPHTDVSNWTGRTAFLNFGTADQGVHGQIQQAVQLYAGTCQSHYRLTLAPGLQRLEQRPRRRVHANLTTPGLIARLLDEHGLENCDYAFDGLTGLYPLLAVRVQYDETDLRFLCRICEEEGIHFRFEHSRQRHRLVFADDPASFAEHSSPLRFDPDSGEPALRHFAQHWSAACVAAPVPVCAPDTEALTPSDFDACISNTALNETIDMADAPHLADIEQGLQRQRAMRELERLRCARYQLRGASDRPDLHSGRVVQVLDHPQTLLNDQWLITGVEHCLVRFEVLEGLDPHDIAAIVAGVRQGSSDRDDGAPPQGYRNRFEAVPWAMTFRPRLESPRPRVHGEQPATVMDAPFDEPGLVSVRYDWQPPQPPGATSTWPLAYVLRGTQTDLATLLPGARVLVAHLDGDPQRPVICGLEAEHERSLPLQIHLDGVDVCASQVAVSAASGQRLQVRARHTVRLQGAHGAVELTERSIRLNGMPAVQLSAWQPEPGAGPDLRLSLQAGPQGEPLADCAWYILRMAQPGLEHLPRIDPRDILFEGTTDAQGYLGLTATQRRTLATLYDAAPQTLCLAYPGHCLTLRAWFQQNWTERQRRAFRLSGL